MSTLSRRKFLKSGAMAVGAASILSIVAEDTPLFAQDLAPVEASNPTAIALGYSEDGTKVDVTKFTKRAGADGAKEFCHNCMFFTQGGLKVAGKDGEYGKCTIFSTNLVNANGWCNSWALKPGTVL